MREEKKILGEERREMILKWLKEAERPLTGTELARRTNVSRQVVVQDISLLKAKKEPIIATSQGYLYMNMKQEGEKRRRVIACKHDPEETRNELFILADHGVTVKDVTIEHPVYGDLTASVMVSTRQEVELFLEKMENTNAALLSELTDGTHLHTIEADTNKQLDEACRELDRAGYLLRS
ncbi:transcription repressor NadR [Bacillus marinisedimentorum]|uniref:transcription repressor NadR n=1 Tax=Bacillus marinisedimentorum TaxID=1821260 RepID=UPI00087209F5|nr:transcription repressor NadR [Bacillus marinisedimentorum]